ncbi:MAG: phenylalanine--tRNA ligase subunit alpha [Gammaproteobacteria bacterium]|nr:phenylalanine--tRNA ligase subunit alpha [Gammaproteobacteria bacterium]
MQELSHLQNETLQKINTLNDIQSLYEFKVTILGKKGQLTEIMKGMATLSPTERPLFGQKVNVIKTLLEAAFEARNAELETAQLAAQLAGQQLDVSLAGTRIQPGHAHPINRSIERIAQFFTQNGFQLAEGPQIEDDFHNFTALNIPEHHPARAAHDTFYFGDGKLLRTHTSNVQIRFMENNTPPLRIISQGRVYRCDYDQTHSPMFHQMEGLWLDKDIRFSHLKGLLESFLHTFFEEKLKIRFRPHSFPFTEPSAEVDVWFNNRWLEVLGCGMVHPHVLKNVNIDPEAYQGFAFGMGIERLTMVRYGITDLRLLFENDVRFIGQL